MRFSILNMNLNLLAAVRFVLEFTPAGQIVPYDDIVVVKPFRYKSLVLRSYEDTWVQVIT